MRQAAHDGTKTHGTQRGLHRGRSRQRRLHPAGQVSLELSPGPAYRDRAALARELPNRATSVYHAVGTCRMGTDDQAVVDPSLKVRGIDGLRVADASIMPAIPGGNTNAPAMMIGEHAAHLMTAGP